jgi:hypothetical protein
LLAPAIVWMGEKSIRTKALPWERVTLVVAALLPLVSRSIAACTHVLLTPAVAIALLAVIVVRIRRGPNKARVSSHRTRRSMSGTFGERPGASGN